jgi:cytoskeletal protein CcmA (bactofilin family)
MSHRSTVGILGLILATLIVVERPRPAAAGCGCTKPPPPPAQVRPRAASPGGEVRIFSHHLVVGSPYRVTFTSAAGATAERSSTAIFARDLADAKGKPQLVVALPELPLGPARIDVTPAGSTTPIFSATDASLTVLPMPIAMPNERGAFRVPGYRAAVSRDGEVLMAFDLTGVTMPLVVRAKAAGYPLRFSGEDMVFSNVQGFTMQLLDESMPGLFSVHTTSSTDSDQFQYSRHEFNTYFLEHEERAAHQRDPKDPNWHVDGTPHIDHDHLVLSIDGSIGGAVPPAGSTPAFDLIIEAFGLFHEGLAADGYMEVKGDARIVSDVRSNGDLKVTGNALVDGDATAFRIQVDSGATVTGEKIQATHAEPPMRVQVPSELTRLGDVVVKSGWTIAVRPGSYEARTVRIDSNATIVVDNAAGPVTIYVTGSAEFAGKVVVTDPDPEKLAVYLAGSGTLKFRNRQVFTGVVYAPEGVIEIDGGDFFGAFVGDAAVISNNARVTFDPALGPVEGAN